MTDGLSANLQHLETSATIAISAEARRRKAAGEDVIDLGAGEPDFPTPQVPAEAGIRAIKDGKTYILMNTFRFFHAKAPVGPSPYWTVRVEYDLLRENDKVNKNALWRIDKELKPLTDRIKQVEEFSGVVQMDRLDGERALTLKQDGKGSLSLVAIALP